MDYKGKVMGERVDAQGERFDLQGLQTGEQIPVLLNWTTRIGTATVTTDGEFVHTHITTNAGIQLRGFYAAASGQILASHVDENGVRVIDQFRLDSIGIVLRHADPSLPPIEEMR